MKKKDGKDPNTSNLRHRAEKHLSETQTEQQGLLPEEENPLKLIHELQVHQIELEMQNAELRQTRYDLEISHEKYADLYDFAPIGYFMLTKDGTIHETNFTGAVLLAQERSYLMNRNFAPFISKETQPVFFAFLKKVCESNTRENCEVVLSGNKDCPRHVHLKGRAWETGDSIGRVCLMAVLDITERTRVALERDLLVNELQQALADIKTLKGLLPICSFCKKIRDDKGYWDQVESYISSHSEVEFSHSICPECIKKHYPEFEK